MNSSCTGGGSGLLRNERWSVRSIATDDEAYTRMYGDWLDSLQSIALSATGPLSLHMYAHCWQWQWQAVLTLL